MIVNEIILPEVNQGKGLIKESNLSLIENMAEMQVKINDEFKNLIPELSEEEFNQLTQNIINEGCRDAIVLWQNFIVDGHNRFKICSENNIKFNTIQKEFKDQNDVIIWIINNQFGRRNLNNYQRANLALKLKDKLAEQAKERSLNNLKQFKNNTDDQISDHRIPDQPLPQNNRTFSKLANIAKVSHDTIHKVEKIKEKANPETIKQLETGHKSINEAYKEIKAEEKIIEREQKQKTIIENSKTALPSNIKLLEGDLFDVINQIPDNSIDLLNTDPPYMILNESWDIFQNKQHFFDFTEKWLKLVMPKIKDTGRIYISFSQWFQYDFYNILLKNNFFGFIFKQNIIWYYKNNNQPSNRKEYRYMYEPIFYLYGKNAKDLNFTPETYGETQQNVWEIATPQSNFNEGKYHPAQKPLELYKRIIQTGSFENDTILDCFAGSGTTGIICNELKRNCFLIENSPENIQIIKGRINNG